MLFGRDVHYIENHTRFLESDGDLAAMRDGLAAGNVFVAKDLFPVGLISRVREYLSLVGRSSIPNYRPIELGCANFHRMNRWDARAHVRGCFHQFVFFPWNDDPFDLFTLFRPVFHLKNRVRGLPREMFLGREPERGCIARLAFQHYPRGIGGLNRHADPVGFHQLAVPSVLMSQKGEDFQEGGAYIERASGERILLDDLCGPGDAVYFNAQVTHGVETIDPDREPDWLSFEGRWMLLFAVNKVIEDAPVADPIELHTTVDADRSVK